MARWQTHRSDGNAEAIISAWRRVGATVELIGRPTDALVGFRGTNYLCEIKTPRGRLRASQQAFLTRWRGQAQVVRSVAEALAAIGVEAQ
jgi:hypothetical protein